MKKLFGFTSVCLLLAAALFAESYKITDYSFDVTGNFWGTTQDSALKYNHPVDTKTIFTEEEYDNYIANYKKTLQSTRLFSTVEIEENTSDSYYDDSIEDTVQTISLVIRLKDSSHFLAVPYPKYSTNDGITLKVKAKDNNFLGSMNKMNAELDLNYDNGKITPGLSFNYDHPFTIGDNKLTWVNDYSIEYEFGKPMVDFSAKSGISYTKPYDKYSYNISALQYIVYENDYRPYDDALYFAEVVSFSTPINAYKFKNYSTLTYTPYINLTYNWDFNGINPNNSSLVGPYINFGQSLSNSKVTWDGNFRNGYSLAVTNNFKYNLANSDFSPSISFEGSYFMHFKLWKNRNFLDEFGIYTHVYAFIYPDLWGNHFNYGSELANHLRGRVDSRELGFSGSNITTTGAALNIDLPHHIFETNFKKDALNFDVQISAFMDIGVYSKGRSFKPALKDSICCMGGEMLIFPKRFSSFTIRGSVGVDVLKALKDSSGIVKGVWHNKEIFIGLGTAY